MGNLTILVFFISVERKVANHLGKVASVPGKKRKNNHTAAAKFSWIFHLTNDV